MVLDRILSSQICDPCRSFLAGAFFCWGIPLSSSFAFAGHVLHHGAKKSTTRTWSDGRKDASEVIVDPLATTTSTSGRTPRSRTASSATAPLSDPSPPASGIACCQNCGAMLSLTNPRNHSWGVEGRKKGRRREKERSARTAHSCEHAC